MTTRRFWFTTLVAAFVSLSGLTAPVRAVSSAEEALSELKLIQRQASIRAPLDRLENLETMRVGSGSGASPLRGLRASPASRPVDPAAPDGSQLSMGEPGEALASTPQNRLVNDRTGEPAGACQSEVSIAAFGQNLVAAWNDGIGVYDVPSGDTQGYAYSIDGGLTWVDGGVPPNTGIGLWSNDPVVVVNEKTGAFYFCALTYQPFTGTNGIGVVKGTFTGNTFSWGTPVLAASFDNSIALADKQWMAADSLTGNLYMTYSHFSISGGTFVSDEIRFLRSTDDGQHWSVPLKISAAVDDGYVQGSRPAVGPDGEIYAVWYAIGQPGVNSPFGRDLLRVRRSTDQGMSFTPQVTADSLFSNFSSGGPGFNRPVGITFPSITVDRSSGPHRGRVYLAWNEALNFYADVNSLPDHRFDPSINETENNNGPAVADFFTPGLIMRGVVGLTNDLDYWRWDATQGTTYFFWLDSMGVNLDASFRIFCSDGTSNLAFNQNGTGDLNGGELLIFTAPTSGVYYLRVASYAQSRTGAYRIRTTTHLPRVDDRARDHRDIFVKYSDGGTLWGPTVRVNDDPGYLDDWLPEVAVDGAGKVWIARYDYRDSPLACGAGSNIYLARSDDGGQAWLPEVRVSDVTTNWSQVYSTLIPNYGDYIGLFAQGSRVVMGWGDGRNGDPDVYFASLSLGAEVRADAGPDVEVECASGDGTEVRLDGSGSVGTGLRYRWTSAGVTFDDPESIAPAGRFPLGTTEVVLEVTDGVSSSRDAVLVTVIDTVAPSFTISLDPDLLWPPNHQWVGIHATSVVSDACDSAPVVRLVSIASDEPGGIRGGEVGTPDFDFELQAERSGDGEGRDYAVCYQALDASRNGTVACDTVRVPHDRSGRAGLTLATGGALLTMFGDPPTSLSSIDPGSILLGTSSYNVPIPGEALVHSGVGGNGVAEAVYWVGNSVLASWNREEPLFARWEADGQGYLAPVVVDKEVAVDVTEAGQEFGIAARPNPGQERMVISYVLPEEGHTRLSVFDVAGHLVARLLDARQGPGRHEILFPAPTRRSQVYFYRFEWNRRVVRGKFAFMR